MVNDSTFHVCGCSCDCYTGGSLFSLRIVTGCLAIADTVGMYFEVHGVEYVEVGEQV
jgi:hypothetical protein